MAISGLISYDVFDTALTRLVLNPDHVHWAVGARLRAQGIVLIGEEGWRSARRKAEDGLRSRSPMSEITLSEIYSEIARALSLAPTQMRAAMDIEVAEEIRLARPVREIQDRVDKGAGAGLQQCFISDTYLSAKDVNKLLTSCGYAPLTVHASSEYRKTKARGDLFATVGEYHHVPCRSMVHIGDNPTSDVSRARSAGCKAVLFEESQPTRRERILFTAGAPGFLSSAIAGAARASRLEYAGSCSAGIRTASTAVAGPILTAYVLWVLLDVVKRGGKTIHFLARDGQILHRICERLISYLKVDVKSRYLLGSRRAFFLAALPQDLEGALTSAFALAPNETVLSVLISLGFTSSDSRSIIDEAGACAVQLAKTVSKTGIEAISARISSSSQRLAELIDRIKTARIATRKYFAQEGVLADGTAYIADLGWRGNLQLRMQRAIADQTKLLGYYVRLYRTPGEIADAVRSWTNEGWPRAALLEVFTLADHGSVCGFELDRDGTAVCVPPLEQEKDLVAWGVRHQQELIDLFVRNLLQAVDPALYQPETLAAALKVSSVASFTDFFRFPTAAEGSAYGSIALAGDQNHLDVREFAPAMGTLDVVRMLGTGGARRTRTNWLQGSLARSKDKLIPAALRAIMSTTTRLRGSRLFHAAH